MYFWFLFTVENCNTDRINTCLGSKWCQDAKLESLAVEPYASALHVEEVKKWAKKEGAPFLSPRGGENRASGPGPSDNLVLLLFSRCTFLMSQFLPDYQWDILQKLSSAFPISPVQFSPPKRQFAQMKTSLNASMVNWMTKYCFPVLSTSSKGVTESLGEFGLLPVWYLVPPAFSAHDEMDAVHHLRVSDVSLAQEPVTICSPHIYSL